MLLSRRSMLFMPAVVAAANLMPVRSIARLLQPTEPYYELLDSLGNVVGRLGTGIVTQLQTVGKQPWRAGMLSYRMGYDQKGPVTVTGMRLCWPQWKSSGEVTIIPINPMPFVNSRTLLPGDTLLVQTSGISLS